jgi:RNA polymerase sigma-70 factor (ECF subfamily)
MSEKSSPLLEESAGSDDMALVQAARGGDVAAFEVLIRRYDRKLFRIAYHITNHRQDTEDVVQETFLKAFQRLAQFRGDSQFATWLTRIGVNTALIKLRERRAVREISIEGDSEAESERATLEIPDWVPNPEELYSKSELLEILDRGLRTLTPALASVFVLRDVEGFSIQQTADILALTNQAVKTRLLRARLKLRESLTKHFGKSQSRQYQML